MRIKPRTIAIAILVAAIAALACAILSRDGEPRYKDRRLSKWLTIYGELRASRAARAEAKIAIRSIGTNALPFLLEWIRYEPPAWQKTLNRNLAKQLPKRPLGTEPVAILITNASTIRAELALSGFGILGTNAAPAVAELAALMKQGTMLSRRMRAMAALARIGLPGISALTNALPSANPIRRKEILNAFALINPLSDTDRAACLPALLQALDDPDLWVRRTATNIARHLARDVLTNAPPQ